MPLLPALNDKKFLTTLMDMAHAYSRTKAARALAAKLGSIPNLIAYIRALDHRPDLGDPDDGPRIGDLISQRVRIPADDPNCVERTVMFLGLANLLASDQDFTAATSMLDEGLHTYPVHIAATSAQPIILDSKTTPLRNLMTATVYQLRDTSPIADEQLVPWFASLARNAAIGRGVEDCHQIAMRALRRALVRGASIENPEELSCLLALTRSDAQLFGPLGQVGYDRMEQSIRNLSKALDSKTVGRYLDKIMTTVQPVAGDVVKAALISQFGPAAGLALHGADINLGKLAGQFGESQKSDKKKETKRKRKRKRKRTNDESKQLMHRMSVAYFKKTT